MSISIGTTLQCPFDEAVKVTRAALAEHGFGVITEIDLQQTFREKLGEQSRPYLILGACNPRAAFAATQAEPEVGLLLPCNVAIYEQDGGVRVAAVDPERLFALVAPDLREMAAEVRRGLVAAIESLGGER